MDNKQIIVGNWKMNSSIDEAKALINELTNANIGMADVIICPSYHLLNIVNETISNSNIKLGAQDCHYELKGAYTGDISPEMLKDVGCSYVILGHSERRKNHFETNYLISKKAKAATASGLTAIICVGETKTERDEGKTSESVSKQVKFSLPKEFNAENIIIAYEPVWAIGNNVTPSEEQIDEAHKAIRDAIKILKDEETANKIKVLYGGSLNADNASKILAISGVDGGLIGGASLKGQDFITIINNTKKQ
ncbi:triose-phosphate isomerase [Rickettsiales bacterium LUAb2]